jgi:hypothetical protein
MASESKSDERGDDAISRSLEDWKREIREKLLEAIPDGLATPLAQADWDEVRCEVRQPPAAASTTPPSISAEAILDPVRREFEESGMSEEELVRFLTEVRDEARRGKRTSGES